MELDHIPQNAAEAEQLIEQIQAPEGEAAPEAAAAPIEEFELNYKGQAKKYDRAKFTALAQQGLDYSEKMGAFNRERTEWEKARDAQAQKWAQVEARLKQYAEIEEYNKKDPAWWEHVTRSYQERQGQAQGGQPTAALPPELQQKISEFDQFMTASRERESAEKAAKEDQALDLQVSSYREKYPQFDWEAVDESGQKLEQRILKYAIEHGLQKPEHFQIAANNYLFEEHLKRAGHAAKEGVGKHLEKVTKLGLGPVTNQPTSRLKAVQNVASKDWNEIAEEAKAALGI